MPSHLTPNLFSNNADFCTRFTQIANKYARDVILLNLEYLQVELRNINERIMEMNATMTTLLPADELKRFKDTFNRSLTKFKENLENIK